MYYESNTISGVFVSESPKILNFTEMLNHTHDIDAITGNWVNSSPRILDTNLILNHNHGAEANTTVGNWINENPEIFNPDSILNHNHGDGVSANIEYEYSLISKYGFDNIDNITIDDFLQSDTTSDIVSGKIIFTTEHNKNNTLYNTYLSVWNAIKNIRNNNSLSFNTVIFDAKKYIDSFNNIHLSFFLFTTGGQANNFYCIYPFNINLENNIYQAHIIDCQVFGGDGDSSNVSEIYLNGFKFHQYSAGKTINFIHIIFYPTNNTESNDQSISNNYANGYSIGSTSGIWNEGANPQEILNTNQIINHTHTVEITTDSCNWNENINPQEILDLNQILNHKHNTNTISGTWANDPQKILDKTQLLNHTHHFEVDIDIVIPDQIPIGCIMFWDLNYGPIPSGWAIYNNLIGNYPCGSQEGHGELSAAALPNITGQAMRQENIQQGSGCFYNTKNGIGYGLGGKDWEKLYENGIGFNARNCSEVYQDNFNSVRPPTCYLVPIIKVQNLLYIV